MRKPAPIRGRDVSVKVLMFEDMAAGWRARARRHVLGWELHIEIELAGQLKPVRLTLAPCSNVEEIQTALRRLGDTALKVGNGLAGVVLKGPPGV